tara:strand:- start:2648 stop:2905 length:258 start_codon:yes stop_codon:yes gene_type:complete
MSSILDIEAIIESLSPEEIRTIMDEVKSNKPTRVDTSRKAKSIAITEAYFNSAPRPKDDFKDYLNHSDAIREQVLSGVDICVLKI